MAFTNIISGTIGGNGNIISTDASFISILSKFQVRYNGTGSWLECSNTNNITGKSNCSFELKLKDGETLTTMQDMFWNCSSLTSLDLSNLDTSSVTNMQSVFNNCSSLTSLNVSNFNTSQVTTMNSMFFNCSSLISLDLSSFNTSQVTNMLTMFQNCLSLTTLDLSSFNTSQVTIMNDIFYNCPVSNIRLLYATSSTINSLVTQLGVSVARDVCYAIAILSELKVQNNITYIKFKIDIIAKYKFNSSLYADYLPVFNTEFTGYTKTDINNGDGTITRIISHDTLKPTLMRFGGDINTSTDREKSLLEVMECDTSNVTNMHTMFSGCRNLISLDASNFDTSKVTNMFFAFNGCLSLASLNLSSFDTSKVTNMNSMFENCKALTTLNVSSWDTSNVTDMAYMFNNCQSLTSLDVSNFNTGKATNMTKIFHGCSKLTSLVLSNFNTSKVENMTNMFSNCSSLTTLDVSNFNTSKVTAMREMFSGCSSLTTLNVSSWDTSNVTDMAYMFNNCQSLTSLDVSNFNTGKATTMNSIFENCSSLTSLNVSSFDTSKLTDMAYMFNNCQSLTSLDVSNFNTGKATNMTKIFHGCSKLTSLVLSNFNTSKVTNMSWMFSGCSKLTTLDLSNFNTDSVTSIEYIFNQCPVPDIGLLYATSSTINSLLTPLGTSFARNIYYTDAPLNELTVQNNITYKKYKLTTATFPYTLNKLPNGVADYIDVVNKVHVQRVGKVTFNGTETGRIWVQGEMNSSNPQKDNLSRFYFGGGSGYNDLKTSSSMLSDKLPYANVDADRSEIESVGHMDNAYFNIIIRKDRLVTDDADGFKTWLQSNPITILHELATPIYTPLTEEELAQLPLSAYSDGYVNLSSDQLMPSFEFRMKASNRYQVDMLETGYYYLNAPIGNVKLGTANVDVQQMPCIVKVGDVGTGDSGYRLGFSNDIQPFSKDFSSTFGYWLDLNNGELVQQGTPRDAYTDYIEVSPTSKITVISSSDVGGTGKINVIQYDKDKTFISGVASSGASLTISVNLNAKTRYIRVSYRVSQSSYESGINTIRIEQSFPLITLSKLPSHRIPTTFTQGMKCAANFGYWEGIKESNAISFRTVNASDNWKIVEESSIENGIGVALNRIEYGNTIVEDEFDIATGKLTKRIGKITFTKELLDEITLNPGAYGSDGDGSHYVYIYGNGVPIKKKTASIIVSNIARGNGTAYYDANAPVIATTYGNIWLFKLKDYASLVTLENKMDYLKRYCEKNPIEIYFELEVPEISYPNITLSQVKTVANTALQCAHHNDYLNPQVKPSHLTYPVPSLVGNRTYTVVHNRKNITGSTKPIELNLGGTVVQLNDASGKTLVKTPSTLAHSNLIFIGGESTVDHIMVLDGDWTNKPIEYFENMKGHDTDAIITIIGNGKIDDVAEQYLW